MKLKVILPVLTTLSILSLSLAAYGIYEQGDSPSNHADGITSSKSNKWIRQSISDLKRRTALSYRVQSYRISLANEALSIADQLGVPNVTWNDAIFRYSAASSILEVQLKGKIIGIVGAPETELTLKFLGDDTFDFHHIGQFELEAGSCVSDKSRCRREKREMVQHLEEQFQTILPEIESKVTIEARRLVNAS